MMIVILTLPIVSGYQRGVRPKTLPPERILQLVARRYEAFSSYEDEGIVTTTYDQEKAGRIEKMPFKLSFKRPNLFRFDWVDYYLSNSGRTTVVWCNGRDTFYYAQPDTYEKKQSLEQGIAAATGVSDASSHNIPRLLLPHISGLALTDLSKVKLMGEEVIDDTLCYHITGIDEGKDITEIWIDKKDYLVRKVRTKATFADFAIVREEVHRQLKINQPISAEQFNYQPPIALNSGKEFPEGSILYADESPVWAAFLSEEGAFTILMPAPPTSQTLTLESGTGKIVHHTYRAAKGGVRCMVDYADIPRGMLAPGNSDSLFNEARDQFLKDTQGKLSRETSISLDGSPGREIKVQTYGGEAAARFYLVSSRLYQIAITVNDLQKQPANDLQRFLNSFGTLLERKPIASGNGFRSELRFGAGLGAMVLQ